VAENWRRLPIPHDVWDSVLKLAESKGVNYQDLVPILISDGLTVRSWEAEKFPNLKPLPPWPSLANVVLEVNGKKIGDALLAHVPREGETVMWKGTPFTVEERAWSLGEVTTAYLRLRPWRKRLK